MLVSNKGMMGDCRSGAREEAATNQDHERISELFSVLADQRRRYAIHCLSQSETPMALADLTDEIVRLEMGTDPTMVPEVRDQIYTQLSHRHLPKLAEANLVNFDKDENLVSLGDAAADAQPYLEQTIDEKWPPNE